MLAEKAVFNRRSNDSNVQEWKHCKEFRAKVIKGIKFLWFFSSEREGGCEKLHLGDSIVLEWMAVWTGPTQAETAVDS